MSPKTIYFYFSWLNVQGKKESALKVLSTAKYAQAVEVLYKRFYCKIYQRAQKGNIFQNEEDPIYQDVIQRYTPPHPANFWLRQGSAACQAVAAKGGRGAHQPLRRRAFVPPVGGAEVGQWSAQAGVGRPGYRSRAPHSGRHRARALGWAARHSRSQPQSHQTVWESVRERELQSREHKEQPSACAVWWDSPRCTPEAVRAGCRRTGAARRSRRPSSATPMTASACASGGASCSRASSPSWRGWPSCWYGAPWPSSSAARSPSSRPTTPSRRSSAPSARTNRSLRAPSSPRPRTGRASSSPARPPLDAFWWVPKSTPKNFEGCRKIWTCTLAKNSCLKVENDLQPRFTYWLICF